MRAVSGLLALSFVCLAAASARAQEMAPKKLDATGWYSISLMKFKPGGLEEALKIITESFAPASVSAGTHGPEIVMLPATGEWDMVVVWPLKGGPADLEWEISPDDVKWFGAMARAAGGPDKAQATIERFEGLIVRSASNLARGWFPPGMQRGQPRRDR